MERKLLILQEIIDSSNSDILRNSLHWIACYNFILVQSVCSDLLLSEHISWYLQFHDQFISTMLVKVAVE